MNRHRPPRQLAVPALTLALALAVILTLASMAGVARAEDVYRWVDATGVTHYGSTPPAGAHATRVDIAPAPAPAAPATGSMPAVGGRPVPTARPAASPPEAAMSEAQRLQQCAFARLQVETLTRGGPVYRTDETGQQVFLPDDQRDAEIRRWQQRVGPLCAGLRSDDALDRERARQAAHARCTTERLRLQELEAPGSRVPSQDLDEQRRRVVQACGGG